MGCIGYRFGLGLVTLRDRLDWFSLYWGVIGIFVEIRCFDNAFCVGWDLRERILAD